MNYPFEKYLYYLVNLYKNNLDIYKYLKERNYNINENEIDELRKKKIKSDNKEIKEFLQDDGLDAVYNDSLIQIIIECLLIKKIDFKEIVKALELKLPEYEWDEEFVRNYSKYFWDVSNMKDADWKEYLNICPQRNNNYYRIALDKSRELLFLELNLEALLDLSQEEIFNRVLKISYLKFKQQEHNSKEALGWGKILIDLFGIMKLEKLHDEKEDDVREILNQSIKMYEQQRKNP